MNSRGDGVVRRWDLARQVRDREGGEEDGGQFLNREPSCQFNIQCRLCIVCMGAMPLVLPRIGQDDMQVEYCWSVGCLGASGDGFNAYQQWFDGEL